MPGAAKGTGSERRVRAPNLAEHQSPNALHALAEEIQVLTQRLEELTKGTPAWYAGTRARVEARATLEQADEYDGRGVCGGGLSIGKVTLSRP
jgi:hypothetical protein